MLAHHPQHLDNAAILEQAKKWKKHNLLSEPGYEAIKTKYPDPLYTPNWFIRIGLFLFTVVCLLAANSLLLLFTGGFSGFDGKGLGIRFVFHGFLMLGLLEILIKEKKIFRCGIDDAILYGSIGCMIGGFFVLFVSDSIDELNASLLFACIALPVLTFTTIRYANILSAGGAFMSLFTIVFILVSKTGEISKFIMPFLIMVLSAAFYLQVVNYRKKESLRFWNGPLLLLEVLSLVLFYLAGNYYIVRTLSEELFELQLQEGEDIPMAFIFYLYTAIIPLAYVFYGLKNKNRVLLQTGLLLIAASVITFKYYYSLGHHEITLTISGIVMIAVSAWAIRYLKTPKHDITFVEDPDEKFLEKFDAEALVIAQTFSGPHQQPNTGPEMGGGKFGGGGADGDF